MADRPQRQSVDAPEYEDAFGRPVTLNIQNNSDLAGHYDFSPERYRLLVNGSRQFVQYGSSPTELEDTVDSFKLKPQSDGDVVTLETTEKFRYAVQYVIEWSAAMQANQALQSGDVITLAYGDSDLANSADDSPGPSADGWMYVWDSSLASDEVRLSQYRNGTRQDTSVVSVAQAVTEWTRRSTETNYYSVGASEFVETYTSGGTQFNDVIGSTSKDDGKGPEVGNHSVQLSVKVGSSGAGSLQLEVGSIGVRTLGRIDPIFRRKTAEFTQTVGSTGAWVPVFAIQIDPDRDLVNAQLTDVNVQEYSASDDVRVLAQAFDPTKLEDSGGNKIDRSADFAPPNEHSSQGSVIETSTAVAEFPDSSGTIGTSATNPGGYQEGYGSLYTSGEGAGETKTAGGQQAKRQINHRDIVVFIARSGTTGDVTVEYTTEQQW